MDEDHGFGGEEENDSSFYRRPDPDSTQSLLVPSIKISTPPSKVAEEGDDENEDEDTYSGVSTISMTESVVSTDSQATNYPLLTDSDAVISRDSKEDTIETSGEINELGGVARTKDFYDVFRDYARESREQPERDVYLNESNRKGGLFNADKMYPCTK